MKLLSKRKEKWAGVFKPKVIRGKGLMPNAAVEQRYYDRMRKLILRMSEMTQRHLLKEFRADHAEEFFAMDADMASQARILLNALQRVFDQMFGDVAKPLSEQFVDDTDKASGAALRSSLKQLSGGLTLKMDLITGELGTVITASINENVALIKSIPQQYMTQVKGAVMRSITTGQGLADLVPFLKKQEGVTLRRARLIAEDQTRKAYSSMNNLRMQDAGIEDFEWRHSGGSQHPRRLHVDMSGNIYSLKNPPVIDEKTGQRGLPGYLINCKCFMVPVVKFNEGSND